MRGSILAVVGMAAASSVAVHAALKITTTSLPEAIVGVTYSAALNANGGPQPFSWTVYSGVLPGGLSIKPGGSISGIPTGAGVSDFTVQVKDGNGGADTQNLRITVNPAVSITTTSLPDAVVGSAYSQTLEATGGTSPLRWTVASGVLAAGLSMNTAGKLSGTPIIAGSYPFTVQVTDAKSATDSHAMLLAVDIPLLVTTLLLPGGTVGVAYSQTLAASGGSGGNTWLVTAGALPAGLTLGASGSITGTATTAGKANFTVQVKDSSNATATQALNIAIAPAPLTVTTTSLPGGTVGGVYSQTLTASGGSGGNSWTVSAGALPAGLTLATSGGITGTPSAAVPANFTVQVKDSSNATATQALNIAIAPARLTVTTTALPGGTVGAAYEQTLTASGGSGGNSWTVSASGGITGTPTAAGTVNFTVQVKDSSNATATQALSIVIGPATLTVTTTALPGGTVGAAYSQTLTASGGSGGNSWTVSAGALPAGLTLATSGGITGTPTAAGTVNFTVQVKDSSNATATQALSIVIGPATLTVTTTALSGGTVGAAYSQTLAASGGSEGNSWTVSAGALPAGLTLATSGGITGTPTAAGTVNFTVQVKDSSNATATQALSIVIGPATLTVTTTALSGGTVGAAYSQTLAASGGSGGNIWTVSAGALPAGLTLATSGGITGTPTTAGTVNFTVQAKDSSNATATQALNIAIAPATLTVTTTSLPGGTVGAAYSQTLAASGGSGGNTWSVSAGALPAGLTLGTDGSITGMPTTAGIVNFTAQVKDSSNATATKALTIAVAPVTLTVTTTALPGGTVGAAYSQTLAAGGGSGGNTWSVSAGALPAGLTLAADGTLSGTPTVASTVNFTAQVKDNSNATATKALSLVIAPATLRIETTSLPPAAVGVPYLQPLTATGGSGNYNWNVSGGALPAGLTLTRSGTLSGTPVVAGPSTFAIGVSDGSSATNRTFTLPVEQPITIVSSTLPSGTVGRAYSATVTATGGSPPFNWAVISGQLPPGLSLDPPTGALSGTPSLAGTFSIRVQITDSAPTKAVVPLSITIKNALTITTAATLATGSAGAPYSQAFAASGGTPPFAWSVSGTLPAGVALSAAGVLIGTPTQVGTFPITVQVTDADSTKASSSYSLQVVSGLAIATPPTLPTATKDLPYSAMLVPAGGSAPYQWIVTTGALPGGLTFSAAGRISGTATSTGSFQFTAQVTDANSNRAQKEFTLLVAGTLAITSTTLPAGATQTPYAQPLTASGGTAPYTWLVTAGSLPDGLTLETPTGALAGTPTAGGTFTFTVTVTDANGVTAQRQFSVSIGEGLRFTTPAALPGATAGVVYSFTTQAAGGQAPYSWSLSQGSLPAGLSLNGASGTISGTPGAAGTFNFTIQVTDAAKATTSRVHSIVVGVPALPSVSINGLPGDVQPLQEPAIDIALDSPYPVAITGTLSLTFTPDSANPVDDPAVLFSTGGRSATFTIPANATHAAFGVGQLAVQTGSVAGTITFSVVSLQAGGSSLTVPDGLTRTAKVGAGPPVIRTLTVVHAPGGVQLQISGMSNTRELTKASITFQAAAGTSIQTPQITVALGDAATAWFQSDTSAIYGGQFGLTLPFTFNGNVSVTSVSVVLTNGAGDSAAASANY